MKRTLLLLALSALTAPAQSTISPTDRHAHGANFGWINFRPSPADGLVVNETTLSGRAWSANFGWLYFGGGQTHHYENTTAGNYGVNLSAGGLLFGYAWSPNAGWIIFEQTRGRPRINLLTGQFHGHAWSANAGWINLDAPTAALRTTSIHITDTDDDGLGDAWEMQHFGNLTAASSATNADNDPASDLEEYRAGTLPNNPNDWLRVVSQSLTPAGDTLTLRFTASPGRLYRIESSANLQNWTTAGPDSIVPDPGPLTEKTIVLPPGPRRFFKVVSLRPLTP